MQTALIHRIQSHCSAPAMRKPILDRPAAATERNRENRPITLAKEIINQYWSHRNDRDPAIRMQAQTLIRSHVVMLRYWRKLVQDS